MSAETKAESKQDMKMPDAPAAGAPAPPRLLRQSSLEEAINQYAQQARDIVAHATAADKAAVDETNAMVELRGSTFVGHTNTDLDSVASAVAAAELFGGKATIASKVNSETKFALEAWGLELPPMFSELKEKPGVVLLDHNQLSQSPPGVAEAMKDGRIKGIIDHHAIQGGIVTTAKPIYVDIRPWGSCCSIITSMFVDQRRTISKKVAGLLLCGIISDTLNLQSPTTTKHDKLMVSILSRLAGVDNINQLAKLQFKAKSRDILTLGAPGVLRGDLKRFEYASRKIVVAFGVYETPDLTLALEMREELMFELKALKHELRKEYDKAGKQDWHVIPLFALVNIQDLFSILLCCGDQEHSLGEAAFGGHMDAKTRILQLGKRVSRKHDFIPPVDTVMQGSWAPPALGAKETKEQKDGFGEVVMECGANGCVLKRVARQRLKKAMNTMLAMAHMGMSSGEPGAAPAHVHVHGENCNHAHGSH